MITIAQVVDYIRNCRDIAKLEYLQVVIDSSVNYLSNDITDRIYIPSLVNNRAENNNG